MYITLQTVLRYDIIVVSLYNIAQAYISQLLYNNLSSKDIEPIRLLYNNKLYSIEELSSIYKVDKKIIEKII